MEPATLAGETVATTALSLPDYAAFLVALKERILRARITAARAVNHELVLLYWDVGRGIVEKQQTAGWGDAVVERLAADLEADFPAMRGFSVGNIWRMRQFYQLHSQPEFLAQAVRETGPIPKGTTKDDVEVEFALKAKTNPIGVAEYQLQPKLPSELKGKLPTARQLSDAVRKAKGEVNC